MTAVLESPVSGSPSPPVPSRDLTSWLQWGIAAVPVLVMVVMAWHVRWMSDDGFIHLRVVQQIVDGNGPVFNVGERVEASTSPLWVAMLVLVNPLTGVALPWKAVLLGIGLSAVGVLAAQRAAVWLASTDDPEKVTEPDRERRHLVLPLGVLVVVALRPFWEFATSGLETGLVFAWLGVSMWWCARRVSMSTPPRVRMDAAGAALVGLGWLIRPDLVLFSLAFGGVLLAAVWPQGWRPRLAFVGAAAALPAAYQIFRMGYYAMVVPNTALAKEATHPQWGQGWNYLEDLVAPYWLWIPVAILVGLVVAQTAGDVRRGDRLRAAARVAPVVASVFHGLYVIQAGGDFMHARLLLPAVFGLVAPVGVTLSSWDRSRVERPMRPMWIAATAAVTGVVMVWVVVCATGLRREQYRYMPDGSAVPLSSDWIIMDEREFYVLEWGLDPPVRPELQFEAGRTTAPHVLPEPGLAILTAPGRPEEPLRIKLPAGFPLDAAHAAEAVGMPSYAWGSDVYVMDVGSLGSPVGSHLDELVGDRPGHQKPVPTVWVIADLTDEPGVRGVDGAEIVPADALRAAQATLGCGDMRRYLRDIREPLTPGRFLGNIVDSVSNTLFRISPDPDEAEQQQCGN